MPALLQALQQSIAPQNGPCSPLTQREIEVLREIGHGYSNREIAARLNLKEKTVKNHINNIYSKLHLQSRIEARMEAMRLQP